MVESSFILLSSDVVKPKFNPGLNLPDSHTITNVVTIMVSSVVEESTKDYCWLETFSPSTRHPIPIHLAQLYMYFFIGGKQQTLPSAMVATLVLWHCLIRLDRTLCLSVLLITSCLHQHCTSSDRVAITGASWDQ